MSLDLLVSSCLHCNEYKNSNSNNKYHLLSAYHVVGTCSHYLLNILMKYYTHFMDMETKAGRDQ